MERLLGAVQRLQLSTAPVDFERNTKYALDDAIRYSKQDAQTSALEAFTIADPGRVWTVREIAKQKMVDLNANDIEAACKMVIGSARSMGIEVVGT